MFKSQQFKLCYCPLAMKNVILEYERPNVGQPKCLNGECRTERECPYLVQRIVPSDARRQ